MILAVDPGNILTAWVLMDGYNPVEFAKEENEKVLSRVRSTPQDVRLVIEGMANYGLPVGR